VDKLTWLTWKNASIQRVEERLLAQWLDFTFGGVLHSNAQGIFSPARRRLPSPDRLARIWVNDALDDFDLMALQAVPGVSEALATGSGAVDGGAL